MLIARAAEGRERSLKFFTAYDMVFMWLQTHLGTFTTAFYSQRIRTTVKTRKASQRRLAARLTKLFWKTTGQAVGSVLFLCTRGGESGRTSPGRARHPDKRAPRAGAVTEATRKLTLNGGADGSSVKVGQSTLTTEHRQKFIWTRRNVNMEKNDIFNTNLLQLPMKAQVADEGVVQDIASVAEHSFQIGYSSAMQTFAEAAAALEAKANVQQ